MLLGNLEKFIAKRVLILYVLFTIINVVFFKKHTAVIGLTIGGMLGFLRFSSNVAFFSRLLLQGDRKGVAKKGAIKFVINAVIAVAVLVASLAYDRWLFIGTVEGILLVPIVIMINGITEALGITRNNFE